MIWLFKAYSMLLQYFYTRQQYERPTISQQLSYNVSKQVKQQHPITNNIYLTSTLILNLTNSTILKHISRLQRVHKKTTTAVHMNSYKDKREVLKELLR